MSTSSPSSPRYFVVGALMLGTVVLVACASLSGADELVSNTSSDEAGADRINANANDGGDEDVANTDGEAPCATYVCGTLCVTANDTAFGCSAARNCQACPGPANGTSVCSGDSCEVTCTDPFLDCNKKQDDGCEADPRIDPANCGTCGNICPTASPFCVNGKCASNCPLTQCGTVCVDLQASVDNCGACGQPCPKPTNGNGTASCVGAKCIYTCATGFADCDTDASSNGCEVFVKGADTTHCGSCAPCPSVPHAFPKCTTGQCGFTCSSDYVDCNGTAGDGCECHTEDGTICRSNKVCAKCSDPGQGCGQSSDCCGSSSLCQLGKCCRQAGRSCSQGTECCSGICSTTDGALGTCN